MEYTDVRHELYERTGRRTRWFASKEVLQRDVELLRCSRTEFWTVRDLRMLTMGVDEWVREFIDCELLAARYLKTARAAQGPKSLIADYTLWTPARQKELITAAAALPRYWRPPRRAVAAVEGVMDLVHNPFLVCAEIGAVMRHSHNVRTVAAPLLRNLTWELVVVAGTPRDELAEAVGRPRAWVNRQVKSRSERLGGREEQEYIKVHREQMRRESPGLRLVEGHRA